MKFKYIATFLFISLFIVSCDKSKEKKETQSSIEEKAKRSSSNKPGARPQTGIAADQAARRVGTSNDQRTQKSQKFLEDSMKGK